MEAISELLDVKICSFKSHSFQVYMLFGIIAVYCITKLVLWLINRSLKRNVAKQKIDTGNAFALFQVIKYIIWVIAIAIMMELCGISVSVLLAGSAALLVGVGFGLQSLFNDVVSGFILLTERSIKVGDILEIDKDIVVMQEIGFRTSKALNRDDISIIIPNSVITNNKVVNWSHQFNKNRFRVKVGVAYGSDIDLVEKVLLESAKQHPQVLQTEPMEARLVDFGNSSIDYELLFYTDQDFRVAIVKSEIRKIIYKNFGKHKIKIPFPQMDVHIMESALNTAEND